jgi:hypothetical protein
MPEANYKITERDEILKMEPQNKDFSTVLVGGGKDKRSTKRLLSQELGEGVVLQFRGRYNIKQTSNLVK